jgi:hypothetical protein
MADFLKRHADKISGVLSCFDRIVCAGTIPGICYAQGMTTFLYMNKIRIFDYATWAEPLNKEIRENAELIAEEEGIEIEFIRKYKSFRKEDRIAEILQQRGDHPGLVHIFSAMETCHTYRPWHNKKSGKTYVKDSTSKCLHYYFYFIDEHLGLGYLRVPTWAPFRLQAYFNGHNILAGRLKRAGIDFTQIDNMLVDIKEMERAQQIADDFSVKDIHDRLDNAVKRYCPVIRHFGQRYHWSTMQAEYATDIIFNDPDEFAPIYEEIIRTAVHAVKPEQVSMFLGKKLHGLSQAELGSRFSTRIKGHSIKHYMGKNAVKAYDKGDFVLRIETLTNDVSFFKHYRKVEHRDGTTEMKYAPMRKSIYSLPALAELLRASNRRYIEFISTIEDPSGGINDLDRMSRPVYRNKRSYRGFNLFHGRDIELFRTIVRGEFTIHGFRHKDIKAFFPDKSSSQISRLLKRLRMHAIIKKVGNTYKYYLTAMGKRIVATSLKLKEMFVIPYLRGLRPCD